MTADPWVLLREVRESVYQHKERLLDCDHDSEMCSCDLGAQKIVLLARIDAALAAHRDEVPAQDSATDVVEWNHYGYARNELRSRINGADVTVRRLAPSISDIDTQYSWNVSLWGGATTLAEAKSAAIEAAKGMR